MLEALAHCGTAAFDKTGTLTTGKLAATSMREPGAAAASSGDAGSSSQQQQHNSELCAEAVPQDSLSSAAMPCTISHCPYVLCQATTASSDLFLCNHKGTHTALLGSDKGRQQGLITIILQVIGRRPSMRAAAQMT